jgi:hypothetical protein
MKRRALLGHKGVIKGSVNGIVMSLLTSSSLYGILLRMVIEVTIQYAATGSLILGELSSEYDNTIN